MIQPNGSRYRAFLRHAMAATNRFFPKKHIPTLFHSCAELGSFTAATRYLTSATSTSSWSWMTDPAARITRGFAGSRASAASRYSNAR